MSINSEVTFDKTVDRIVHHIMEKKGEDIVVIDLHEVSSISDYFVIATGNSNVHLKAIADEVREKLKQEDHTIPLHVEGYEAQKWILLDYIDVVVHLMDPPTREYYSLEKLWDDADIHEIETEY